MPVSLIGPEQDFALWAVLFGLAAFGFWCERYPWGRKYTGVMLMMTLAIILSNLRIIPTTAPVYDIVWEYLVPLAIALLLFRANLRKIIRESGPVLLAFLIGSAAGVAGTLLGVSLLDLGEAEAELAGVFSATYIGGSLNFAAVAEASQFHDSSLLAASVAADNVVTNLHFLLIIMLPGIAWLTRYFPTRHMESAELPVSGVIKDIHRISSVQLPGLLGALALAFALAALGKLIADHAGAVGWYILSQAGSQAFRLHRGRKCIDLHLPGIDRRNCGHLDSDRDGADPVRVCVHYCADSPSRAVWARQDSAS